MNTNTTHSATIRNPYRVARRMSTEQLQEALLRIHIYDGRTAYALESEARRRANA